MVDPNYQAGKDAARANRHFYESFQRLDLDAMRALWLPDDRVRCVHPAGELIVGFDRVIESWRIIFEHTDSIRFEISDLHLTVNGDMAIVTNIERIRSDDDASAGVDSALTETAATNIYMRDRSDAGGGDADPGPLWRMLLHHASPIARRFFKEP